MHAIILISNLVFDIRNRKPLSLNVISNQIVFKNDKKLVFASGTPISKTKKTPSSNNSAKKIAPNKEDAKIKINNSAKNLGQNIEDKASKNYNIKLVKLKGSNLNKIQKIGQDCDPIDEKTILQFIQVKNGNCKIQSPMVQQKGNIPINHTKQNFNNDNKNKANSMQDKREGRNIPLPAKQLSKFSSMIKQVKEEVNENQKYINTIHKNNLPMKKSNSAKVCSQNTKS